jgi:hypothetical protein
MLTAENLFPQLAHELCQQILIDTLKFSAQFSYMDRWAWVKECRKKRKWLLRLRPRCSDQCLIEHINYVMSECLDKLYDVQNWTSRNHPAPNKLMLKDAAIMWAQKPSFQIVVDNVIIDSAPY